MELRLKKQKVPGSLLHSLTLKDFVKEWKGTRVENHLFYLNSPVQSVSFSVSPLL